MNKFSSIVRFVFISITILSFISCEKDNETIPPTIIFAGGTFIAADTTVEPETELVFFVEVTAGSSDLKWIQVKELNENASGMGRKSLSGTEYCDTIIITAPFSQGEYIYEFTVMDNNNQEISSSFKINVVRTPGEIVKYLNIRFEPENINENLFFSCTTGKSYSYEEAYEHQEDIDIVYITANYFTSPGSDQTNGGNPLNDTSCIHWETKNYSAYYELYHENDILPEEFNNCNDDNLFYDIEKTTSSDWLFQQKGDIFGIMMQNGRKGLIYITEITNDGGNFYITFDIIIQK